MSVYGLSHLVYTVPSTEWVSSFELLKQYSPEVQIETLPFDPAKNDLLTKPCPETVLHLYRPPEGDRPAMEFIFSNESACRNNVRLLLQDEQADRRLSDLDEELPNDSSVKSLLFSSIKCSDLKTYRCNMGLQIWTPRVSQTTTLLSETFNCRWVGEAENSVLLRTRVVNRKMSSFLIMVSPSQRDHEWKNDHLGLSTLGWLSRSSSLPMSDNTFKVSPTFNIGLEHGHFRGCFIYDNTIPSFEVLEKLDDQ